MIAPALTTLLMLIVPAGLLLLACLSPLARRVATVEPGLRGRRQAALALHRRQLDELGRDLGLGLVAREDAASARLEIERRLLAEAATGEPPPRRGGATVLLATLALVPLAAVLLYAAQGHPTYRAQPLTARLVASRQEAVRDDAMIEELRSVLATVDPRSDSYRQGQDLLAGALAARGRWSQAAAAWQAALAVRFDAGDAFRAAEAQSRADGHVSGASASLFRAALDAAPDDAPWRAAAQHRLAEAKQR